MLRKIRGLIRASHLPPTLAVTAATTVLAVEAGRGRSSIWVAVAVLAGQLSVGWSNDAFDAARDTTAGRREKPIVAGDVGQRAVAMSALLALVASVPLSLASGWRAASVHLIAIGAAWSYNAGIKSTWLSPIPYALAFGLLPAFVTLGLPGHPWPLPAAMGATALIGVGAHFINTVPDVEHDLATGIAGLPQQIGPTRSLLVGVAMLALAAIFIAALPSERVALRALVTALALLIDALVVIEALQGNPRAAWLLTLLSALVCLGLFVASGGNLVAS